MTVAAAEPTSLAASLTLCERITSYRARNFHYGMRLVPEPKRSAMYAIYAWMREADDLADEAGDEASKRAALDQFRADTMSMVSPDNEAADQAYGIWPAVRWAVIGYSIPTDYLHTMIDGQALDLQVARYRTFDALYEYCYKVASVVGMCCLEIWEYRGDEETRQLAEWRGIAFQLTNILRDVMEDAQRNRVYLPAEDFDLYELNPSHFTLGKPEESIDGLLRVAQRAEEHYEKSAALDSHVHPDGRACLWAMTRIYRGLLDKIQRDPARVLSGERVRLHGLRKAMIALGATWRARFSR